MKKSWIFSFWVVFFCLIWIVAPASAGVLSNEQFTVSVGNEQSWTGRNGTGNLSYYGCDQECNCIYLTGGKITCRNGVCTTTWQNQNYTYVLSSPITQVSAYGQTPSSLTISSDSEIVMTAELYPKPFDNIDPN
ncbi:MAG: hypothetical protein QNJ72_11170 [Pleurocapsa sp. MO_226.B13]|nr:hypothetical protein [Pleurocapsa sp. MO_226.B13]